MDGLQVLLVCGSGASSGFMAANLRKTAKAHGVDITVTARSEAEIESYVQEIDVLMVGPHLSHILDEVDDYIGDEPVTVILMKPEYYATLDGELAFAHLASAFVEEDAS